MSINGSCGCGAVRFAIDGAPSLMGTCHCTRCRKFGTPVIVFVKREQFRLLDGKTDIQTMDPGPTYKYARSFCRLCGTGLGEPLSDADAFPINAHCLDDDPVVRNAFHEFVTEKPAWLEICDDAPRFPGHPTASDGDD